MRKAVHWPRRGRSAWVALLVVAAVTGCSRKPAVDQVLWSPGGAGRELRGSYGGGDVATGALGTWLVYDEESSPGEWRIRVRQFARGAAPGMPTPLLASLPGRAPSLLVHEGRPVLLCESEPRGGEPALLIYMGSPDGRTWSAGRRIPTRSGRYAVTSGRLLRTSRGDLVFPATRGVTSEPAAREIVCLRSSDRGNTWSETSVLADPAAADPALAEYSAGKLLLVARRGAELARCESLDDGATWSTWIPMEARTDTLPPALRGLPGGVVLAWTDPPPDTSWAVPGLRAVRLAVSTDGGAMWRSLRPLVWSAGRTPWVPALAFDDDRLTALVLRRAHETSTLDCVSYAIQPLQEPKQAASQAQGRYAADPGRAAAALELLCEHTLARPETSIRLFIEGYFMRSLVAGHEVLRGLPSVADVAAMPRRKDTRATLPPAGARLLDTQQGLTRAITFADWMLTGQDSAGYWPLGYKAVYVADMAAVTGLFAALVPHVDAARARRYEAAAVRFTAALERDGMFLPSGACGVGWPETRTPHDSLGVREPYLVSTGLAGIELQAWLYSRTRDERYRQRALVALDYTLSQLGPDGSFPAVQVGPAAEGAYVAAAYVQEGWMAADFFLQDDAVLGTLRQGLRAHVGWLVRTQNPDGTWGSRGADGEWARTPPIVDFLIWYDQRCASNADDARRGAPRQPHPRRS